MKNIPDDQYEEKIGNVAAKTKQHSQNILGPKKSWLGCDRYSKS